MAFAFSPVTGLNDISIFPDEDPLIRAHIQALLDQLGLGIDTKTNVIYENPIAPTLLNSWVNDAVNYAPLAYYKDSLGIVHLQGRGISGTVGQNAFVLPTGYRPAKDQVFERGSNVVLINVAGSVNFFSGSGAFNINSITFRAGV